MTPDDKVQGGSMLLASYGDTFCLCGILGVRNWQKSMNK